MPEIPLLKTITVNTPRIEVTDQNNKPLPPGQYKFSVTVEDDLGAVSAPAEITVTVAGAPRVDIKLLGTQPISPNNTFTLEAVVDDPNKVEVKIFRWTRVNVK
jgi:hypothetical protein